MNPHYDPEHRDEHDDENGLGVVPADPAEQHRTHHAICRQLMQAREDAEHVAAIRAMRSAARAFDVAQFVESDTEAGDCA